MKDADTATTASNSFTSDDEDELRFPSPTGVDVVTDCPNKSHNQARKKPAETNASKPKRRRSLDGVTSSKLKVAAAPSFTLSQKKPLPRTPKWKQSGREMNHMSFNVLMIDNLFDDDEDENKYNELDPLELLHSFREERDAGNSQEVSLPELVPVETPVKEKKTIHDSLSLLELATLDHAKIPSSNDDSLPELVPVETPNNEAMRKKKRRPSDAKLRLSLSLSTGLSLFAPTDEEENDDETPARDTNSPSFEFKASSSSSGKRRAKGSSSQCKSMRASRSTGLPTNGLAAVKEQGLGGIAKTATSRRDSNQRAMSLRITRTTGKGSITPSSSRNKLHHKFSDSSNKSSKSSSSNKSSRSSTMRESRTVGNGLSPRGERSARPSAKRSSLLRSSFNKSTGSLFTSSRSGRGEISYAALNCANSIESGVPNTDQALRNKPLSCRALDTVDCRNGKLAKSEHTSKIFRNKQSQYTKSTSSTRGRDRKLAVSTSDSKERTSRSPHREQKKRAESVTRRARARSVGTEKQRTRCMSQSNRLLSSSSQEEVPLAATPKLANDARPLKGILKDSNSAPKKARVSLSPTRELSTTTRMRTRSPYQEPLETRRRSKSRDGTALRKTSRKKRSEDSLSKSLSVINMDSSYTDVTTTEQWDLQGKGRVRLGRKCRQSEMIKSIPERRVASSLPHSNPATDDEETVMTVVTSALQFDPSKNHKIPVISNSDSGEEDLWSGMMEPDDARDGGNTGSAKMASSSKHRSRKVKMPKWLRSTPHAHVLEEGYESSSFQNE